MSPPTLERCARAIALDNACGGNVPEVVPGRVWEWVEVNWKRYVSAARACWAAGLPVSDGVWIDSMMACSVIPTNDDAQAIITAAITAVLRGEA